MSVQSDRYKRGDDIVESLIPTSPDTWSPGDPVPEGARDSMCDHAYFCGRIIDHSSVRIVGTTTELPPGIDAEIWALPDGYFLLHVEAVTHELPDSTKDTMLVRESFEPYFGERSLYQRTIGLFDQEAAERDAGYWLDSIRFVEETNYGRRCVTFRAEAVGKNTVPSVRFAGDFAGDDEGFVEWTKSIRPN